MPQEAGHKGSCMRGAGVRTIRFQEAGRTLIALLVLGLVLVEVESAQGQLFFTRQPRARQLLQSGREAFARGDYEKAAQFYQQAQAGINELSPTEQSDLKNQMQQNNLALQERKAGAVQLKQAEEALQKGHFEEAARLLKRLDTNQYLAPADRKALTRLTEQWRKGNPTADTPANKKDYRTLVNEARAALQRGELELAERLADQADKANTGIMPTWLQPWNDTPARVRRDIQTARQKTAEKARDPATEAPKNEGTGFPAGGTIFGFSSTQPAKDSSPAATDKKEERSPQVASSTKPPKKEPTPPSTASDNKTVFRPAGTNLQGNAAKARQLLTEANLALQKGDTARARQLMEQAEALQMEMSQLQEKTPNLRPVGPGSVASTNPALDPEVRPASGVNPPAQSSGPPVGPAPTLSSPPAGANATGPAPPPAPPMVPLAVSPQSPLGETPTEQARRLVKEGYLALRAGDYARAKQMAEQARALKPELKFWEDNPEKLLKDIERVAPVATAPARSGPPDPAASAETADPRALLKQARDLLEQGQLEEAERLANRAAAMPNAGWRLFEDSPTKVRADVQKRRQQRDREEAQKLLAEARKLFSLGQLKEAKELAWKARTKYGSPTIWDLGDRPDRLINEIEMVEVAQKLNQKVGTPPVKDITTPPVPPRVDHQMPPPPPPGVGGPVAQVTPPAPPSGGLTSPGQKVPPAPIPGNDPRGTLARQKTLALVAEARALQREGKLIEARSKALEAQQAAMEAQKLGAVFAPTDDTPDLLLFNLASMTGQRIGILLKRVEETAARTSDPARFDKARLDLEQARQLASAYGLDQGLIKDKATWLQQLQTGTAQGPALPGVPKLPTIDPPPSPPGGVADLHAVGKRLLDDARRELAKGQLGPCRKMLEEAFDPKYGVQDEVQALLRTLDIEEVEQRRLAANRNADAVRDAYLRKQFHQAAAIASTIDIKLLTPDKLSRLKEIMSMPEMQPQALAQTGPQQVGPGVGKTIDPPGSASATDLKPGPVVQGPITPGAQEPRGFADHIKALEEVQFGKLREEGLKAQNDARKAFQAGDYNRALELLREYNNRLAEAQLDPAKLDLLRRPIEKRWQEYRTLQAEAELARDAKIAQTGGFRREQLRLLQQQKKQEQVSELMKEYRELYQQGKYKEAKMVALKAKDIDPENVAVDAALQMSAFQERISVNREIKSAKEDRFLRDLDFHPGPYVDAENPLAFNRGNLERLRKRGALPDGISFSRLDAKEREIEHKLHLQKVNLNFKDAPLAQALDDLQGITGINIVPDDRALELAGISLKQNVSLRVEDVSLKSALNLLLQKAGLTYVIKNQVIEITTLDNAKGKLVQRTYPVADLVIPAQDHSVSPVHDLTRTLERLQETNQGIARPMTPLLDRHAMQGGEAVSTLGSGAGKPGFGTAPGSTNGQPVVSKSVVKQTIEDQLIKLITTVVAPDSWAEVGGKGTIQYYPLGLGLVVNQTLDVQEQVADLLRALRKLQDLEVAIEVRLIAVSESFFERIGLDFDVNVTLAKSRFTPQLLAQNFQPFGFPNAFIPDRFVSGLTPAGTFTPDLNVPLRFSSFDFSLPPFGGYPGTLGADGGLTLGLAFLSDIQVFMLLEAAQGDRRMNIMQAPRVTVFNGQSASVTVNQNQFFLTGIQPTFLGDLLTFLPQQQPFPVNGILINITPVVTADRRFVRINFPQLTMTNLASTNVPLIPIQVPVPQRFFDGIQTTNPPVVFQMFFQQPAFETINVSTTVTVPDGGTVLLGGMKTLSEARNEFGPPILSKIPYLNRLVKNVGYGREASSLMIMVTPRIIINEEEEQIYLGELPPIPR